MSSMSYEELDRALAIPGALELPQVAAVAGGEAFLRSDALARLRRAYEARGLRAERFDHEKGSGEELVSQLRTMPMFGERTLFIVKSVRQGNTHEFVSRFKDVLMAYLEKPSKIHALLFDGETWNGSMSVPKAVKKDFLVVECPEFKPWQTGEIERFIERRAKSKGMTLDAGVAGAFREACGGSLAIAEQELEKLSLVVQGRKVTDEDLAKNLNYRGTEDAFALCDAVMDGERAKAMALAAQVVQDGDPGAVLQLLGLLESQYRKTEKLASAIKAGASPQTALAKAGFNPRSPRANKTIALGRSLETRSLAGIYSLLLEADMAVKSQTPDLGAVMLATIDRLAALSPQRHGQGRQR